MHWEGEGRSDEHSTRSRVPGLLQEATGTQTTTPLLAGDFRGSVEAAPMGSHVPRSSSLGSGLQCGSGRMVGMHRIGQVPEMGEEDSIMKNPGYNSRKVETTEEHILKS